MLSRHLFLLLAAVCTHALDFLQERPDWLGLCKRSDPELNECIRNNLQHMFPALSRGIPEVDVDKFEPMFIKDIGISKGDGGLAISGALTDLYVHGPSNASVTNALLDLKKGQWEFGLMVPYLKLESKYNIKGQILLLPVVGTGDSTIHLRGAACHVTMQVAMVQVQEREILNVTAMHVDFSVAGMRLHLTNLLNGNKVLGHTVNQFLNNHALQVIAELKEDIGEALSKVFIGILNNAFKHLPTDLWLPAD